MDTTIAAPVSCEVRAVISFLHAGRNAAEIHCRLCRVYGGNVMSDSCVREWCRKFRDGHTDVHDEGGEGQHSIVTDELVQKVDQCVRRKRCFTISELLKNFHKLRGLLCIELSRTYWFTISSVHGGYQNN
jgi:transposase